MSRRIRAGKCADIHQRVVVSEVDFFQLISYEYSSVYMVCVTAARVADTSTLVVSKAIVNMDA